MSKSIAQLFPVVDTEGRRIQADIPNSLFEKADKIRRQRKLKWNQVMTVLLDKFVEELQPRNEAWKPKPEGFQLRKVNSEPPSQSSFC